MRRTIVTITIPYSLRWDSDTLDILVEGRVFEVHFKRRGRKRSDEDNAGSGIVEASGYELPHDRRGRVSLTTVEIRFPMYVQHDLRNLEELENWVRLVINRLLEVYRYVTEDFHVNIIPKQELPRYKVGTIREDVTIEHSESNILNFGGPGAWLTSPQTVAISDKAEQLLREGTELSTLPEVLYLNAKREEFFENYRLAVVEAETAFEALVDEVIARYYRREGLSKVQVRNKLRAPLTGDGSLINVHLPRCCRRSFENTIVHTKWDTDLYQLRNAVVHDGEPVNANQAKKALDAAKQAMQWIKTHCA